MRTPLFPPFIAWPAVVCCAIFIIWRGVIPGWTVIETDFPNYYTAGRIVLERGAVEKLYDDAWFQHEIEHEGIDRVGKFSPFPPLTAVYAAPLALLPPLTAQRLSTVINILLICASIFLLAVMLRRPMPDIALLVLVSGIGLANNIRFGQWYAAMSFAMIFSFFLLRKSRPILSGIVLGIFIPVKYYPIVLLLYFVLRREYRAALAAVCTTIILFVIGIAVMGWELHRQFFAEVLGEHLEGSLSLQSPYAAAFQTFPSLCRNLFLYDPVLNPHPVISSPGLFAVVMVLTVLLFGFITLRMVDSIGRDSDRPARYLALLALLPLMFASATATYHFILLWLPVALLVDEWDRIAQRKRMTTALVFYAAIGFIPYSWFLHFASSGNLLVLAAYPRLWLSIGLFAAVAVTRENSVRQAVVVI